MSRVLSRRSWARRIGPCGASGSTRASGRCEGRGFVIRSPSWRSPTWANVDDRLPLDPFGRVEGGDGVVEGRDVADVGPQSSVSHPLDDLTQLGTIGLDDEVDCEAVGGPRLGRPY